MWGGAPDPRCAAAPRAVPAPARPEATPHQRHRPAHQPPRLAQKAPAFPPSLLYQGPLPLGRSDQSRRRAGKALSYGRGAEAQSPPTMELPLYGGGGEAGGSVTAPVVLRGAARSQGTPREHLTSIWTLTGKNKCKQWQSEVQKR